MIDIPTLNLGLEAPVGIIDPHSTLPVCTEFVTESGIIDGLVPVAFENVIVADEKTGVAHALVCSRMRVPHDELAILRRRMPPADPNRPRPPAVKRSINMFYPFKDAN